MEESLSVTELIKTGEALQKQDREAFRRAAIVQHGEDPFEDEVERRTVADVARKALGKDWGDEDVNAMNADLEDQFGVNAFGYEVE